MSFAGSWKFHSAENVDALAQAVGVTSENLAKIKSLDVNGVMLDIKVDGNNVCRSWKLNGEEKYKEDLVVGQEAELTGILGHAKKVMLTKTGTGATIRETGKLNSTQHYVVSDDTLTVTIVADNGVEGKRYWKRV